MKISKDRIKVRRKLRAGPGICEFLEQETVKLKGNRSETWMKLWNRLIEMPVKMRSNDY